MEEPRSLVLFGLSGQWYGVDIAHVREIMPMTRIVPLPYVCESVAGIINWHGNILSVINLGSLLERTEKTTGRHLIVVESGEKTSALASDVAVEMVSMPAQKTNTNLFIEAEGQWGGKTISILELYEVLERSVQLN